MLYTSSQSTADGLDDADRHVRARHGPRQGAGAGAEPRRAGPAEAARGHAAARRRRPRSRLPDLTMVVHLVSPGPALRHAVSRELRARCTCATSSRASTASATRGCSAPATTAMRVWLDPDKVAALNLTASDVVRAIREQNVQVAAGQLGAPPAPNAARLPALDRHARPPRHRGRVRGHRREDRRHGQITRLTRRRARRARREHLRACARCSTTSRPSRSPSISARRSNAIEISDKVRATMEELAQDFPQGIDYDIVYDPTMFVRAVDRRRRAHACRSAAARRARRRAVPADLARVR